ncbi:MAG TPA: hypothetical protein VGN51_15900 [Acidimicrobiia bacterium]
MTATSTRAPAAPSAPPRGAVAVAQRRDRPVALVVDKRVPTPQGVRLCRLAPDADVAAECAS